MVKFIIDRFQEAADRFEAAQAAVLQEWQPACGCPEPGGRLECRQCSENQQLQLLTQLKLSAMPETVFPTVAPLPIQAAHPKEVRQHALKLYKQGVPLEQIQAETGVADRHTIRDWARKAGLPPRLQSYPAAIREQALLLYESGKEAREIEALIKVPADTIHGWVHNAGLTRSQRYTVESKERCLELYRQGQTPSQIQVKTGVKAVTIRRWVTTARISHRSGSPRKYSDAERQQCLALREEGKEFREIEMLTGINETTVRTWVRQLESK